MGQVDHGPMGVFLGDASGLGLALVDRELSRPAAWPNERERCRQAGIPEAWRCATKPQLAQQRLARAWTAGVPVQGVTGDRVSGGERRVRRWLEDPPPA